ncbi:MAG: hypothetical protein J1G06_00910 [Oscillospiraceae bacterium]|nr:hypothetical protein [Oscillospiraceae bacterium]
MENKDKQKKSGLRYMILSVIIAVAIWSLISYTNNPEISKTFHNIRVSFNGEGQMKRNGYVVIDKDNIPGLSVKVSGQRSDLIQALDNVRVSVDLSDITAAGNYDLTGTVQLPNSKISLEKQNFSTIPVTIDEYVSKEIPIEVRMVGTSESMVESVPANETIIVKGAKSELTDIASAYVTVDAGEVEISGDISKAITLADSDGRAIKKPETVEADEYIIVTNTLYKLVTLPVTVQASRELEAELDLSATEVTPSSIEVGILPDTEIMEIIAVITDISSGEAKVELQSMPGLYIPESVVKTIKVKPVIKQNE